MPLGLQFTSRLLLALNLTLFAFSAFGEDEMRTWSDSSGKHKIKAKLEAVEDGKAILIRDMGKKMTIDVDKLSKADQDYLAEHASDSPFQEIEDSPFEPAEKESKATNAAPREVKVDWSRSKEISLLSSGSKWKVALHEVPPVDFHPKSVSVPPKQDFWEGLNGMAVDFAGKRGVIGYGWKKQGDQLTTERLVLCDMESGEVAANASGKYGEMIPFALHDDGKQILMRRNDFGGGNGDRLEMWAIKGKNVVRTLSWIPFSDDPGWGHDVNWAAFLDANKLALCSGGGKLAIWNLSTCQPICHLRVSNGERPALSPDRKRIAFIAEDTLGLLDLEKQKVIASVQIPRKPDNPAIAFSPSGKRIGCVAGNRIFVWDAATGKLEKDFPLEGIQLGGEIAFPDEGFILAGNQFLIELENQLKFWQYQGADRARTVRGTTYIAASGDGKSGVLLAEKLPHPEALDVLKKALGKSDLFAFSKGTPVKLDVSGIPDATEQAKAKVSLTKKLDAMGCPIAAAGKVEFVAYVEGPKSREISYMHAGTFQVQEYFTKLKIVYEGKNLWESQWTNIPGMMSLSRGENIADKLAEASSKPSYQFYEQVVLPEFLQKQSEPQPGRPPAQTIGQSTVTPRGIR